MHNNDAFPLLSLPKPALANVLFFLSPSQGAALARCCRALRSAYDDDTAWKRRCWEDETLRKRVVDWDALENAGEESWKERFRKHSVMEVKIVTVFQSMRGTSISSSFVMSIPPRMSVAWFLHLVGMHPGNEQHGSDLYPFDPKGSTFLSFLFSISSC